MTHSKVTASIESYDINQLMSQTRQLAADYRSQTGQALPVTEELARFDAITQLDLEKVMDNPGIDAADLDPQGEVKDRYLVKGRVIFKGGKARQKLGKLNLTANWTQLLMVIYDADYHPSSIYQINRQIVEQELDKLPQDKRGSMTVAKFKAIGSLVWEDLVIDEGLNKLKQGQTSQEQVNQTQVNQDQAKQVQKKQD